MKKLWNKVKSFFKPKTVVSKPTVSTKDLQKKTKAELEKLGRKLGVELDKRLTKDKLIKQIKKASK